MSIFNSVPSFTPPRSRQIQKSSRGQDMELGIAYPIYFKSLVPGDNVKFSMSDVIRSLPMVKPTMGDIDLCINAFFVDYRQIDPDFETRISGGDTGDVEYTPPVDPAFTAPFESGVSLYPRGSNLLGLKTDKYTLLDYCGHPVYDPNVDTGRVIGVNLTPYRPLAYNRCWNYYYRDENVCVDASGNPIYEHDKIGDGRTLLSDPSNTEGNVFCLKPGSGLKHVYLEKDYLGSILPRRQKGGPFAFPITGEAPVVGHFANMVDTYRAPLYAESHAFNTPPNEVDGGMISFGGYTSSGQFVNRYYVDKQGGTYPEKLYDVDGKQIYYPDASGGSDGFWSSATRFATSSGTPLVNSQMFADLGGLVSFTYDEFREIRALQLYSERMNLCGSRYEEFLMSMFSVAPHSDTLREPVWLGGFSQPIVIGEVMQNTPTSDSPLGNYGGKGSSATSGHFFNYFAKDYGELILIAHIRPRVMYTQGVDRQCIKRTRFEWFNPLFAGLSEQEVLRCEAFTKGTRDLSSSKALQVLGFAPRYSEMYFDKSIACGDLRDNQPYWLWSRKFGDDAVLNAEFAMCKHEEYSDRWVVTDEPPFICLFNYVCDITRPCKAYPVPEK